MCKDEVHGSEKAIVLQPPSRDGPNSSCEFVILNFAIVTFEIDNLFDGFIMFLF
jgi:hypothetical protein